MQAGEAGGGVDFFGGGFRRDKTVFTRVVRAAFGNFFIPGPAGRAPVPIFE